MIAAIYRQCANHGWGYVLIDSANIQEDNGAGLVRGTTGLVNKGQPRTPEHWGALRAWEWGAARGLDYLETDAAVDAKHVGIEGVSRYGKASIGATIRNDSRWGSLVHRAKAARHCTAATGALSPLTPASDPRAPMPRAPAPRNSCTTRNSPCTSTRRATSTDDVLVRSPRPNRIIFGSHVDSVPEGGNFDGNVGVLGAIEVARTFSEHGIWLGQ